MRFSSRKELQYLGVTVEHNLLKFIEYIKLWTDLKML
jgi:hypothetical protein